MYRSVANLSVHLLTKVSNRSPTNDFWCNCKLQRIWLCVQFLVLTVSPLSKLHPHHKPEDTVIKAMILTGPAYSHCVPGNRWLYRPAVVCTWLTTEIRIRHRPNPHIHPNPLVNQSNHTAISSTIVRHLCDKSSFWVSRYLKEPLL